MHFEGGWSAVLPFVVWPGFPHGRNASEAGRGAVRDEAMKRILAVSVITGLSAALVAAWLIRKPDPEPVSVVAALKPAKPTLYCEFYNFVGRSPKVGFTFALSGAAAAPRVTQLNQIESDGTRTAFESEGIAAPLWTFEAGAPPTLVSPGEAIRILLYGYEGTESAKAQFGEARSASAWFEAGLRSIQYLNLDGKCRRSGA